MQRPSKLDNLLQRLVVFGVLPIAFGLGGGELARRLDAIWLTDAGEFWPYTLSIISALILIRLAFSAIKDNTSAVFAWLALFTTWFYVPLWFTSVEVPIDAAVISREGHIHLARDSTRHPVSRVWLLTDRPGTRAVYRVAGTLTGGDLSIDYSFAKPYIATRANGEDASERLFRSAIPILEVEARRSRGQKIAFLKDKGAQERLLSRICLAAVQGNPSCPIRMTLTPRKEATAPGAVWSTEYSESEAIAERHLPSLVRVLTRTDAAPARRDEVFALLAASPTSCELLAQLTRMSQLITDEQFDAIIARLLSSADCGDAAVSVANVNRLSEQQRVEVRSKALREAPISLLVERVALLRISDAEVSRLAERMQPTLLAEPAVAVRVLEVFGNRLSPEMQRAAVDGIIKGKAGHALSALRQVPSPADLRKALIAKVVSEAVPEDFAGAHLSKENLQTVLTPREMRLLIAMAVKRSEGVDEWQTFALETLPISAMTSNERSSLLNGLLFKSPKAALEFASKNRHFLDPEELVEVTRDYARTITPDFCLHLSHRNRNWRTDYFSEAQLTIFKECGEKAR